LNYDLKSCSNFRTLFFKNFTFIINELIKSLVCAVQPFLSIWLSLISLQSSI
jgi:hypothetical protein